MPTPAGAAVAASVPRRHRSALRRKRSFTAILFLLPALAINLLVIAGPGIASVVYSFTDWNGISPPHFIGFDNFVHLWSDDRFWNALRHNAIYMVVFLTVPLAMGLLGAFLLSRITRGAALFRVVYFLPYIMVSVVNAQVWKNLLNPDIGIAVALNSIGIHALDNVYFLGQSSTSLASVMFVDNWHFWGFLVVLFLAAMHNVDPTLYEAARIDGATSYQEFRHVTLPGIRPTVLFALTLIAIGSLLAFDYAYILTSGGPAGSSDLVALLINREAFRARDAGYAAAIALSISALSAVILAIIAWLRRREDDES